MPIRLPLIVVAALLLSACGNKSDLLRPAEVPPEDRGRFLIKSSIPTQEERDAQEAAAWEEEDAEGVDDADDDGFDDPLPADSGAGTAPAVPVIRDVPAARDTP